MNKKMVLLATAIALVPPAARADMPVVDFSAIGQAIKAVKNGIEQLAQLRQTFTFVASTYEAIRHGNISALISPALDAIGLQDAVPLAYDMRNVLMGGVSVGSVNGLVNGADSYFNSNQGSGDQPTDVTSDAQSLANVQAMMQQQLDNLHERLQGLRDLREQLAHTTDIKETADLQARIAYEQNMVGVQTAQIESLALSTKATLEAQKQRNEVNYQKANANFGALVQQPPQVVSFP